ncbi:caspase family protein [Kaistella rhinocerotis]|uniref:caspase family protein n=1 Tax=Kaistella rhinocerotis TaxID=3026437 RepID=UPI00255480ED|nr:caspase family protein [Kaistella sp. Ran72]
MENFFALIIGVGGDLPATVADANAIYHLLSDPQKGGYPNENIEFLTETNASKQKVLEALERITAASRLTANPTVLIYYSGHGLKIPREDDPLVFDFYLKTSGADLTQKEETLLNGNLFSQKINELNADKILVLLDCCHADGMKAKEISVFEQLETVPETSNRLLFEKLQGGEGRVFISACDDDEKSVILPGSDNSLFTEVCLEVFNGNLSPTDEFVSVVDLIYFVVKEVPKRVLPYRHTQRPIITEVKNLSPDYFVCRNGNYGPLHAELEGFGFNNSAERLAFISDYDNKI